MSAAEENRIDRRERQRLHARRGDSYNGRGIPRQPVTTVNSLVTTCRHIGGAFGPECLVSVCPRCGQWYDERREGPALPLRPLSVR